MRQVAHADVPCPQIDNAAWRLSLSLTNHNRDPGVLPVETRATRRLLTMHNCMAIVAIQTVVNIRRRGGQVLRRASCSFIWPVYVGEGQTLWQNRRVLIALDECRRARSAARSFALNQQSAEARMHVGVSSVHRAKTKADARPY